MSSSAGYRLPSAMDDAGLLALAGERFELDQKPARWLQRRFFDSFDWRLHRKGYFLCTESGRWVLGSHQHPEQNLAFRSAKAFKFTEEMGNDQARALLAPILGRRALLPTVTIRIQSRPFGLMDENRKTVLRGTVEKAWLVQAGSTLELGLFTILDPVRGYRHEAKLWRALLEAAGAEPASTSLQAAYAQAGLKPGSYSGNPSFRLDPCQSAGTALRVALAELLDLAELNLDGIRRDTDNEFLHDFRTSVRRARTLLSRFKGIWTPGAESELAAGLRWLNQISGPLRDLDVYLTREKSYAAMLPPERNADLKPFFHELARRRKRERRLLLQHLASPQFGVTLKTWRDLTSAGAPSPTQGPAAEKPILPLLGKKLLSQYAKLARGADPPLDVADAAFHELRIHAKKMRYLLEFGSGSAKPKPTIKVLTRLKKLLSLLGDFHDNLLQQRALDHYVTRVDSSPHGDRALWAAGYLAAKLNRMGQDLRIEVRQNLAAFIQPSTRKDLERLFRR